MWNVLSVFVYHILWRPTPGADIPCQCRGWGLQHHAEPGGTKDSYGRDVCRTQLCLRDISNQDCFLLQNGRVQQTWPETARKHFRLHSGDKGTLSDVWVDEILEPAWRDRSVRGLRSEAIQKKLLAKRDLDRKSCQEISLAMEMASQEGGIRVLL